MSELRSRREAEQHDRVGAQIIADRYFGQDGNQDLIVTDVAFAELFIAAKVAVKPPRDPPQTGSKRAPGHEKWQPQQQQDIRELMPQFPSA